MVNLEASLLQFTWDRPWQLKEWDKPGLMHEIIYGYCRTSAGKDMHNSVSTFPLGPSTPRFLRSTHLQLRAVAIWRLPAGSSSPQAGQNSTRRPLTANGSLRLLQAIPSRSSLTSERGNSLTKSHKRLSSDHGFFYHFLSTLFFSSWSTWAVARSLYIHFYTLLLHLHSNSITGNESVKIFLLLYFSQFCCPFSLLSFFRLFFQYSAYKISQILLIVTPVIPMLRHEKEKNKIKNKWDKQW